MEIKEGTTVNRNSILSSTDHIKIIFLDLYATNTSANSATYSFSCKRGLWELELRSSQVQQQARKSIAINSKLCFSKEQKTGPKRQFHFVRRVTFIAVEKSEL